MKRLIYFLLIMSLLTSCGEDRQARFTQFNYFGQDPCYDDLAATDSTYFNPILTGNYPDPSVCRVGDTYYMVTSSYAYYPSIPVFSSIDLVTWYELGNATAAFDFKRQSLTQGIYAPTIRYNKANKTFYIIASDVGGRGAFILKSTDPNVGWSEPIFISGIGGPDPSLFFDNRGRAYILHSDEAPHGRAQWEGHRSIRIHIFDTQTDKVIGEERILVDGGAKRSRKPKNIECPRMYKIGSRYYLMCSEGGMGEKLQGVMFVSRNVLGPFRPCAKNPILSQHKLDRTRTFGAVGVGHADLVDDVDGKYWAVFSGSRPTGENFCLTGRETFLLPFKIAKGQPAILSPADTLMPLMPKANLDVVAQRDYLSGNVDFQYTFGGNHLSPSFVTLRAPREDFYSVERKGLNISLLPTYLAPGRFPALLGRRVQHSNFTVETTIDFVPGGESEFAGLALVRDENNYSVFGITYKKGRKTSVVATIVDGKRIIEGEAPISSLDVITLRIVGENTQLRFQLVDGPKITDVCTTSALHLSTQTVSPVGVLASMYCTSCWKEDEE